MFHPCVQFNIPNKNWRPKRQKHINALNRTIESILKHWVKKRKTFNNLKKSWNSLVHQKDVFHSEAGRVKRDKQPVSRHTSSCETGLCWVCRHETMAGVLLSVRDLCFSFRGISRLRISSAFVIYQEECVMRWLCTFPRAPTMPQVERTWACGSEADGLCQQRQMQLWFNMPRPLLQQTINYFKNSVLDRNVHQVTSVPGTKNYW